MSYRVIMAVMIYYAFWPNCKSACASASFEIERCIVRQNKRVEARSQTTAEVVGHLDFYTEFNEDTGAPIRAFVLSLEVDRDYRRRGIGSQLLSHVLLQAAANGCPHVDLVALPRPPAEEEGDWDERCAALKKFYLRHGGRIEKAVGAVKGEGIRFSLEVPLLERLAERVPTDSEWLIAENVAKRKTIYNFACYRGCEVAAVIAGGEGSLPQPSRELVCTLTTLCYEVDAINSIMDCKIFLPLEGLLLEKVAYVLAQQLFCPVSQIGEFLQISRKPAIPRLAALKAERSFCPARRRVFLSPADGPHKK